MNIITDLDLNSNALASENGQIKMAYANQEYVSSSIYMVKEVICLLPG